MAFGMTMIKVKPSQDSVVYESIRSIRGVKEIYKLFGEYNFFLIMEAFGDADLSRIVDEIGITGNVVEIRPFMITEDRNLLSPNLSEPEESTLI